MPSPPAIAAATKATRTTSGSTSKRSAIPVQTPPRIRFSGSRRSGRVPPLAVASLVAIAASMLGPPAQPERDEDRPHRREGDGGEAPEAKVDGALPVEEQHHPESDQ